MAVRKKTRHRGVERAAAAITVGQCFIDQHRDTKWGAGTPVVIERDRGVVRITGDAVDRYYSTPGDTGLDLRDWVPVQEAIDFLASGWSSRPAYLRGRMQMLSALRTGQGFA